MAHLPRMALSHCGKPSPRRNLADKIKLDLQLASGMPAYMPQAMVDLLTIDPSGCVSQYYISQD